jgi:hypothetical protein
VALESVVIPALLLAHLAVPPQSTESLGFGGVGDGLSARAARSVEKGGVEEVEEEQGKSGLKLRPLDTDGKSQGCEREKTYGVPAVALGILGELLQEGGGWEEEEELETELHARPRGRLADVSKTISRQQQSASLSSDAHSLRTAADCLWALL